MAHAVVGLLDDITAQRTRELWSRLEARHGLTGIFQVPYPHVSFHVAQSYDVDAVKAAMVNTAADLTSVSFSSDGFGFFTGPPPVFPVLFRPVARTGALETLRTATARAVAPHSHGGDRYYDEAFWKPHITVASRDLDSQKLAAVVADLVDEPVDEWVGAVDRLGLILEDGTHALAFEVPLGA